MAYCEERAVPHSHFLGEDLRWTPADRAKVLAYRLEKAERCTRCGTAEWQWRADPFAFEAVIESCQGCLHQDAKREEIPSGSTSKTVILLPREVVQARRISALIVPTESPVEARRRARAAAHE